MAQRPESSTSTIVAALILGVALIVTGLIVKAAIDNTTAQLNGIKQALEDTQEALQEVASARPAGAPTPSAGPSPSRRYKVDTEGVPFKGGVETAKVTILEFSDFQ